MVAFAARGPESHPGYGTAGVTQQLLPGVVLPDCLHLLPEWQRILGTSGRDPTCVPSAGC
jgi:hypothetical protein